MAAPAWVLAHSEHLARPPGTRWWNHLPGPQPTPRRGSSRILLHHRTGLDAGGSLAPDALTNGPSLYLGRRPTPTAAPKWGRLTPSHWATSRDSVRLQPSIGDRPLIPDAVPAPARRHVSVPGSAVPGHDSQQIQSPSARTRGGRTRAEPAALGLERYHADVNRRQATGRTDEGPASAAGNRPRGEAVTHSWPGIKPSARESRIASRCSTCFMEIWVASLAGVLGALVVGLISLAGTRLELRSRMDLARDEQSARTLDEQRRICAEFLTQADEFLDVLREMTARLERAGTSDVAENLQHRYAASWNAFATARSSVLIVCLPKSARPQNHSDWPQEVLATWLTSVRRMIGGQRATTMHTRTCKGFETGYTDRPDMPDPGK